jgi:hypothetical protein
MTKSTPTTDADILAEIIGPDEPTLPVDVARCMLELRFSDRASRRIEKLLGKNSRGEIGIQERFELEKYLRVGQFLDLLHAKARLSLKHHGVSS